MLHALPHFNVGTLLLSVYTLFVYYERSSLRVNSFADTGRVIRKIDPAMSEGVDRRILRGVRTPRVGTSDETSANRSTQKDGGKKFSL